MFRLLLIAFAAALPLTGPALAATIDVSPIVVLVRPALEAIASAVITIVATAVGVWARRWFGLAAEARMRDALHSALTTAAGVAIADISDAAARKLSRLEIESELVAGGVGYVLRGAPDAVRFFGLDEEQLAEMVRSRIVQILPQTAPVVAGA